MIVRLFKSNNASAFVFLPLIALAVWILAIVFSTSLPIQNTMPFFDFFGKLFSGITWLGTLMAMLLVIAEAFLLNYIVNENEILKKQSYLPALFYLLFMSNNNTMLRLHPLIFANLFLLLALNRLLNSYRKDKAFSQAFDAGFLISIATLFYFPYIVFFPVLGIAFVLLRPFIWREWIISFIGVVVPYSFVLTYYFWNDLLMGGWKDKLFYSLIHVSPALDMPKNLYFTMLMGFGIIIFSFGKLFSGMSGGAQKSKNAIVLLIWFFVLSIVAVLIGSEISTTCLSALAIPASVFSANYFLNMKKQWLAETLLLLLLSSILITVFLHFF